MKNVEWGKFRVGQLFKIENTLSFNTNKLVPGKQFDYVTRTSQNQGVLQKTGFVNSKNINQAGTWSLGLLQMDFFYRQNPWYAGQFVRKVIPIIDIKPIAIPFFTSALNKLKQLLLSVLVRNVDKTFLNSELTLPIKKDGDIDFDFMERFVADLEAERIEKLEKYLSENKLNSYELTEQEIKTLENFENIEWEEFKIGNLFERINTKKLPFKADELSKHKTGKYNLPCLTSSFKNQGLNYFAPKEGTTILRNVISIPSNSDIYRAYYQSSEFTVLSDAYAIRWILDDVKLLPNQYLFAVQCINKVTDLPLYSYKNKLGGWNIVKSKYIQLPIKNDKPDYRIMDILISAINKSVIKELVLYVERKKKELNELNKIK
ncbi:restriction endonuclease subunit S [Chryseobacterium populi]|uniref:Type I restriction modification DNA specificity protein n=1 Tax=Chryseobacterium populi TaxID=1144316 RepID=J3CDD5_9FLAO|nr:restriction endonuclease subunit S [Chryseobacterium populi]EJL69389.1 type I restriction modification DNA specificity protein [Chryseobacterium populi]